MVYEAIDEVNAQSSKAAVLIKSPEADLLGGNGGVDSLTFVNLIVALEERIEERLGEFVVLVDEDTLTRKDRPFRTVGALTAYVESIVNRPALV